MYSREGALTEGNDLSVKDFPYVYSTIRIL